MSVPAPRQSRHDHPLLGSAETSGRFPVSHTDFVPDLCVQESGTPANTGHGEGKPAADLGRMLGASARGLGQQGIEW